MSIRDDVRYTAEHEWVAVAGDVATVGITHFAADTLGDIVYVELPEVDAVVEAGAVIGELESTKSVGELFCPVSGTVVERNEAVVDSPDVVNADPQGDGWLLRVRFTELPELLDAAAYRTLTEEA